MVASKSQRMETNDLFSLFRGATCRDEKMVFFCSLIVHQVSAQKLAPTQNIVA
jgi:hypothetical protein